MENDSVGRLAFKAKRRALLGVEEDTDPSVLEQ